MATIEIRDVLDNETGKTIFPRTHVDAVIGLKDFSFFEKVQDTNDPTKFSIKLKSEFTGLWAEGWIASGGVGSGGGGGGYVLPIASASTLGGIKVGSGLSIDSETGVLSVTGGGSYTLPTASANTLGGVKVGSGLSINQDGVLSATGGGSSFNGGEITNDLWLHTGSEDYGSTLYFGDKNGNTGYAYIKEDSDDHLTIYARSGITLSTGDDAGVVINNLSVALGALSNVSLSSPTNGQSLVYRDGVWQNETVQGSGGGYIGYTSVQSSAGPLSLFGIPYINATNSASSASRMVWDSTNNAWHFYGSIYADGWIAAGGIGGGGSGGGSVVEVTQRLFSGTPIADIEVDGVTTTLYAPSGGGGGGISSVSLASGTNNGTLKLTVDSVTTDNIAVKGLGDLAYKSSLSANDIPDISGKYVTLDTTQNNISGAKTFTAKTNFTGGLAVPQTAYIDLGPIRIKFENNAIHITKVDPNDTNNYGLYADGFVSAGGIQ